MKRAGEIRETLQQLRVVTKYGMSGICLLMTIHCGLLYLGYDLFLIHIAFWLFVMLIGYKLSCIFGLCWVHKLSVIYSMGVILCVAFKSHNIFGFMDMDLQMTRGVMFFIGVVMCGLNVWKILTSKKIS